jgi:anti-sigma factor RsiW
MKWFWTQCGRHRQRLCLLAGGALPHEDQADVKRHLAECAECRAYYEEIKAVAVPLANWEGRFVCVEPSQAAARRWRKAVHDAGKPEPVRWCSPGPWFQVLWRELIRPNRRAWAGMAALWLTMWGINAELFRTPQFPAGGSAASAPVIFRALQEERRLMAELIPPGNPKPAEPPRRESQPRPRTERVRKQGMA